MKALVGGIAGILLVAGLFALMGTAYAHGGLQESNPAADARVKKVPGRVTMTFSEIPSKDSVMKVVDGCQRDVVGATSVTGNTLVGSILSAQPGTWKVSFRVISAEDGHLTRGNYRFTVAGKKDCNPNDDQKEPTNEPTGTNQPEGGKDLEPDDDSFPVVPVAVGAAGLVIVGFVVRRVSGG